MGSLRLPIFLFRFVKFIRFIKFIRFVDPCGALCQRQHELPFKHCPKDTRHFMNFINLINFMNSMAPFREEVVPFVVDDDECREVFYPDFADGFHT